MCKGIECYVDTEFAGNWYPEDAEDRNNLLSRTGGDINKSGCPSFKLRLLFQPMKRNTLL